MTMMAQLLVQDLWVVEKVDNTMTMLVVEIVGYMMMVDQEEE